MGTGDNKVQFTPSYEPIFDDVIGKLFSPGCVRSCPHPKVIAKYGTGGVANVSVWTCKRCRFHTEFPLHAGIGCAYGLEDGVQPGT